jgi:hypothetical protein
LDIIDFNSKRLQETKKAHYTLIKGSVQQEDVASINIYELNDRLSKYEAEADITEGKKTVLQ